MEMFFSHFPELAEEETRCVNLLKPTPDGRVPAGSYALVEAYCTDPSCDCRRVMLNVIERARGQVATISYGFDRDGPDAGPYLDPLNPQSPYAEHLMKLIDRMTLHDPVYLARLERHYALVKEKFARPGNSTTPKAGAAERWRQYRKRGRAK